MSERDVERPAMTRAQKVVWDGYIARVQMVVDEQLKRFAAGERTVAMTMLPPTAKDVAAMEAALADAVKDANRATVDAALGPVVDACDVIDNSKAKSQAIKKIRESLDEAYKALHGLRGTPEVGQ